MDRPLPRDAATTQRLRAVRSSGTAAELAVRALVTQLGIRYRTRNSDLPGSPDLANRRKRWAIFVHGCFWHRHAHCRRSVLPKNNATYWLDKFARNRKRDRRAALALRRHGFRLLTIWECQLRSDVALHRLARFFS